MAFAAVISLKKTTHRLKNHTNFPRITNAACDEELDSLIYMLRGLDDESSRMIDRSVIHELDAKIRDAVWKLEDVLDKSSYHCLNNSPSQGSLDEKGVKQEMNSFLKKVKILREEYERALLQNPLPAEEEDDDEALSLSAAVPPVNNSTTVGLSDLSDKIIGSLDEKGMEEEELSLSAAEDEEEDEALSLSAAVPPVNNSTTVGLSDLSQEIIDQLLCKSVFNVSVVGMAGIGKTHLAALIYHNPDIVQHFHVRLWVRAGPKYQPSDIYVRLEEFAIICVEGLVSKSFAIVCEQRFYFFRGKIKSLKLHSAYWYVCVKEARKSKFLHVLNKLTDVSKDNIEKQRRFSVQNNILLGLKEVYDTMAAATSTTRSLLCTGEDHQYPVRICFDMMLLMRVLDAQAIRFYEFPNEVLKLLQLRYLSLTHNGELPSSINKLQQLQSLILRRHHNIKVLTAPTTYFPDEIWDIEELRHLRIMRSNLHLLTLYVNAHSCSEAVFRGIPYNLKKLGITIELEPDAAAETVRCLEHIWLLRELQSLKCVVVNPRLKSSQLAVAPPDHLSNLPKSLKKLSLNGLGYPWKYVTVIGSLPNLIVLKLRCSAFQGAKWETKALQFWYLKFMLLEDIDLVHWTAKDNCFQNLCHLSIRHCYKLKKIPSKIGDISNLEMMEVDDCSPSVVASAQQIKDKRNSSHLKVVINSSWNL